MVALGPGKVDRAEIRGVDSLPVPPGDRTWNRVGP